MYPPGVGFWKGAGIPSGPRTDKFFECGGCGAFHRADFWGDCREDSERFNELPEGAEEVFFDEDGSRGGAVKQIGSQNRETLQEAAFELVSMSGRKPNRTAILRDKVDGNTEIWWEHDDFAGYVVEIDGVGFEFVSDTVKG